MAIALVVFYGLFAFVASLNLILMRRPGYREDGDKLCFLIPARNEENNLRELISALKSQLGPISKIYVFDDESEDGTAQVALELGAVLLRAREPLPKGWTGKNRACHELGKAAAEDSDAEWFVFLDADTRPNPRFAGHLRELGKRVGPRIGVLTGFPTIRPGRGLEPLFLAWVGWILLATNPFGLVCRTRMGHSRFTNGQIHAWRADVYTRLWPNEQVKSHILEDVMMGRFCAKEGVQIEVANLSAGLKVRMYETWRQALDGMSKNSFEITGSFVGTVFLALFLAFCGIGWVLAGGLWVWALGLLLWSGLMVAATCRTVLWPIPLMPIACLIGAFAILRSAWWKKRGQTTWKGRTYV